MAIRTLKEVLQDPHQNKYGIGMFDVFNLEMTKAVIRAAEKENTPVIMALAEVHAPTKEKFEEIANIMVFAAKRATVPVVLHLDHGCSMEIIETALACGFSSVMYDGSILPYEENVKNTQKVVAMAKQYGVSVEAELGHVGGNEGEDGVVDDDIIYTEPDIAQDFVEKTKVDALAVSIGTAHGLYRKTPKLRFDILKQIRETVDVPLVLHGGSGLSEEDFIGCIENGISKVNIYTEIVKGADAISEKRVPEGVGYYQLMEETQDAMEEVVAKKIRLFKNK